MKAKLPECVTYWCQDPENFTLENGEKISVIPVFPTEQGCSERVQTSAKKWASADKYEPNPDTKRGWKHIPGNPNPTAVTVPNQVVGLRVIGFDVRGNGGRAWKVLDADDRMHDLREDQFLAALQTDTLVNGQFQGSVFAWARIESQMKLVLVGSALYKEVRAAQHRGKKPQAHKS